MISESKSLGMSIYCIFLGTITQQHHMHRIEVECQEKIAIVDFLIWIYKKITSSKYLIGFLW